MTSLNTSTSALDFDQIAQLKSDAKADESGSVKEVAQQFESIFINMMLQSMRKATERSGLMDSEAAQTYESMFDQELALHLSEQGGFGVAEALERQIQMNQSQPKSAGSEGFALQSEPAARLMHLREDADTYAIERKTAPSPRMLVR
ncbi:MAG: rod-binding protein [Pseudomonadota bacterium]|nr:rod-binding protein [Pseudomonadota bacterium]